MIVKECLFSGLLEKSPAEANAFLSNPEEYKKAMRSAGDAQARERLEQVAECLVTERCVTFEDCIRWARTRYMYLRISCLNCFAYKLMTFVVEI